MYEIIPDHNQYHHLIQLDEPQN